MNYEDTAVSRDRRVAGRSRCDGHDMVGVLPMKSDEYHCLRNDHDRGARVPEALGSRRA